MDVSITSGEGKPYCFKPKPGAVGLIPVKRRSVKRLILDDILQCFRSLLSGPTTTTFTLLVLRNRQGESIQRQEIMIIRNHVCPTNTTPSTSARADKIKASSAKNYVREQQC
ncbi:hypothetical protein D8674_003095 [Pyrus ussuriensis x Pyrus communis]|uniref:Uncharacterized protein n=1 Tax=Pyrus ussuriensis x Pyrus communis TaxID=2448454 RepID=A0A5N5FLC8_9ROSA|nr:hypothetical protein D8674_003095 [Pyrus ussuriensis x Pyrus communis]